MRELLPDYDSIPKEFKNWNQPTWGRKLFSTLFYKGGSVAHPVPKEGIDKNESINHIRAIMGSYEPKYEHKSAACAYLFDLWFKCPDDNQTTPSQS